MVPRLSKDRFIETVLRPSGFTQDKAIKAVLDLEPDKFDELLNCLLNVESAADIKATLERQLKLD